MNNSALNLFNIEKDDTSQKDKFLMEYENWLQLIADQKFETIARISNGLREGTHFDEQRRRLLSTRVSLLQGNMNFDEDSLDIKSPDHPWIEGESCFLKGICYFHRSDFSKGYLEFKKSEEIFFREKISDRFFLSKFNCYVALVNSNQLNGFDERIETIQSLEREMFRFREDFKIRPILSLVFREKATILYQQNKFIAALKYAEEAAEGFRAGGTLSDWHLSLLLASISAYRLKKMELAKGFLEQVSGGLETRVHFAHELMSSILNENFSIQKDLPNPDQFEMISLFWFEIYESIETHTSSMKNLAGIRFVVSTDNQTLTDNSENKVTRFNNKSLAARLVKKLSQSKCTRQNLCEFLWPDAAFSDQLDNRLHQLLHRIKSNYNIATQFDGACYSLKDRIEFN